MDDYTKALRRVEARMIAAGFTFKKTKEGGEFVIDINDDLDALIHFMCALPDGTKKALGCD